MVAPPQARTPLTAPLLALVALVAAALALAPAAQATPIETVPAPTEGSVRAYWTAERMRQAEPLELPAPPGSPLPPAAATLGVPPSAGPATAVDAVAPGSTAVATLQRERLGGATPRKADPPVDRSQVADPSQPPFRSHGKVFLTVSGGIAAGDYVCSGTALSSNNRSVVWTAGHCVFDDLGGGYATNFTFVPAYLDGAAPYGEWPATKLAAPKEWQQNGNLSYDLGAAVVAKNGGKTLAETVGGRGIGFNQPRTQDYTSFGYPAQQPPLEFTGGRMFRCDSPLGGTDNPPGSGPSTNWIACDMNGGSSGGGWVANGAVLSVNSYSYCIEIICEERLYGPYQDDTARDLYEAVAGKPELCAGKPVTVLGTDTSDNLVGTPGPDVFKAGGGNDRVVGKGGSDRICGGDGNDDLGGGAGKDKLKGQDGGDSLAGGRGGDTCNGGRGRDSARSCEKESKVP
jgi:V8-like Glu-specific endopeptidase